MANNRPTITEAEHEFLDQQLHIYARQLDESAKIGDEIYHLLKQLETDPAAQSYVSGVCTGLEARNRQTEALEVWVKDLEIAVAAGRYADQRVLSQARDRAALRNGSEPDANRAVAFAVGAGEGALAELKATADYMGLLSDQAIDSGTNASTYTQDQIYSLPGNLGQAMPKGRLSTWLKNLGPYGESAQRKRSKEQPRITEPNLVTTIELNAHHDVAVRQDDINDAYMTAAGVPFGIVNSIRTGEPILKFYKENPVAIPADLAVALMHIPGVAAGVHAATVGVVASRVSRVAELALDKAVVQSPEAVRSILSNAKTPIPIRRALEDSMQRLSKSKDVETPQPPKQDDAPKPDTASGQPNSAIITLARPTQSAVAAVSQQLTTLLDQHGNPLLRIGPNTYVPRKIANLADFKQANGDGTSGIILGYDPSTSEWTVIGPNEGYLPTSGVTAGNLPGNEGAAASFDSRSRAQAVLNAAHKTDGYLYFVVFSDKSLLSNRHIFRYYAAKTAYGVEQGLIDPTSVSKLVEISAETMGINLSSHKLGPYTLSDIDQYLTGQRELQQFLRRFAGKYGAAPPQYVTEFGLPSINEVVKEFAGYKQAKSGSVIGFARIDKSFLNSTMAGSFGTLPTDIFANVVMGTYGGEFPEPVPFEEMFSDTVFNRQIGQRTASTAQIAWIQSRSLKLVAPYSNVSNGPVSIYGGFYDDAGTRKAIEAGSSSGTPGSSQGRAGGASTSSATSQDYEGSGTEQAGGREDYRADRSGDRQGEPEYGQPIISEEHAGIDSDSQSISNASLAALLIMLNTATAAGTIGAIGGNPFSQHTVPPCPTKPVGPSQSEASIANHRTMRMAPMH